MEVLLVSLGRKNGLMWRQQQQQQQLTPDVYEYIKRLPYEYLVLYLYKYMLFLQWPRGQKKESQKPKYCRRRLTVESLERLKEHRSKDSYEAKLYRAW